MFYEKTYHFFTPLAINCDLLNLNYLNLNDLNICNYLISQLPYYPLPLFNKGNKISQEQFIKMSIEEMKIFGTDLQSKITDIIPSIPIYRNNRNHIFQTLISYDASPITGNVLINTGKVHNYNIPKTLFDSDISIMAHEHCHSLKDTNYDEYINIYTIGETLPIFYELISNETNINIKKRLLQTRLFYLNTNKNQFLRATKIIEKQKDLNLENNRTVYNYVQSRTGCYLTSFYYAIILYHLYKENPQKILSLISQVLYQYKTTLGLLQELDIYGDIQGEIFEKELKNIKKILKK